MNPGTPALPRYPLPNHLPPEKIHFLVSIGDCDIWWWAIPGLTYPYLLMYPEGKPDLWWGPKHGYTRGGWNTKGAATMAMIVSAEVREFLKNHNTLAS